MDEEGREFDSSPLISKQAYLLTKINSRGSGSPFEPKRVFLLLRFLSPLLLFVPFFASAATQPPPASQSENQFGVSQTLFATMVALNAAGYDAGLSSPLNQRYLIRTQIRDEIAKKNIPCLPDLKDFYREHRLSSDTANLSQYISFALVAGDAPTFELPAVVPPDVEPLRGFSPLLVRFYKEANLADLWKRAQPAYQNAILGYQDPVIATLFEANGYIRNASGYLGRRFEIFLDLLAAPDQIQVRSYRDDYFVVISPASRPLVNEIRDAYLAYVLDPLTFKYSALIKEKSSLGKYAQDAPALDLAYKDNFSLLVTKSLIKAIDSRLMHQGPEARNAFVNQSMQDGFVLTAAFADLLQGYEKQQESMREYYPDMISAIDVRKEQRRLKNVQFAQSRPQEVIAPPAVENLPPAEATLQAAEGLYQQQQYEGAAKLFKQVFEETSDRTMHGRAYYGLARVAVHENRKEEAVELFQRTADANPSPAITAWAHVYLGRLALAAGKPDAARDEFKLALAQNGASQLALDAAQKGLQTSSGDK